MTYRVLHSSDHHLEGIYPEFSEAAAQKLRDSAWQALEHCAEIVRTEAADAWVICGDLLEDARADITFVDRLFETFRGVAPSQVVLVPGRSDVGTDLPYFSLPMASANWTVAGAAGWDAVNLEGLPLLCRGSVAPETGVRQPPRPRGRGPHPAIAFVCGSCQKDSEWFGEGAAITPGEVRTAGVHAVAAGSHNQFVSIGDAPPIVYCGSPSVMDWRDAGRVPGVCFWEIPEGSPPKPQFLEIPGIRLESVDITAPDLAAARSLIKPLKVGTHLWVRARVRLAALASPADLENFRRAEEQKEGLNVEIIQENPVLEVRPDEPTLRAFYEKAARADYPKGEDSEESALWADSVVAGLQALEEVRRAPHPPGKGA
jgi:DNA repair exonuclease SbcCD nuclease subunit